MSFAGPTWASCSLRGLPLPSPSSSSALLPSASALVHRVELSLRYWCCQPMRREARNLCRAFFYRSWSQTQGCEPTSSLISSFLGKRIVCFVFTSRMEKECTSCDITNAALSHHGVVIRDPLDLEKKKRAIRSAGLSKLQVIADFDMTLTKYKVNGERGQSSHALLHQGNAEYDLKRRQLFNHYYPLEVSSTIPVDEKTKLMEEWWEKTHSLLIEGGLNHAAIVQSVKNAVINFRDGVVELFELLESSGVPLLIFSAGLADIIEEATGPQWIMILIFRLSAKLN
ncbi:hypothetical protein O6H91_08G078400 [Diphasiastrum complanatum]|uniref:Uncharacterized protein n=1 Tax=Diphasiastrum complanatum TaxID=34168 RepID=A0ACC2CZ36_DIPCM|nr:hypothetical protein O6H91_08G078400 [Diphasiastrum complanatum]